MKLVESADGTVKVVELDPAKQHWIIADVDTDIDWENVQLIDGLILLKRPGSSIEIVEGETPPRIVS